MIENDTRRDKFKILTTQAKLLYSSLPARNFPIRSLMVVGWCFHRLDENGRWLSSMVGIVFIRHHSFHTLYTCFIVPASFRITVITVNANLLISKTFMIKINFIFKHDWLLFRNHQPRRIISFAT